MPSIQNQLNRWGLLPHPEQITELYFANPGNLSSTYKPNQAQTLTFAVSNHQDHIIRYAYTIGGSDNPSVAKQVLASDIFTVKPGHTIHLTVQFTPQDLGDKTYISCKLSTGEQIGFWVKKKAASRP